MRDLAAQALLPVDAALAVALLLLLLAAAATAALFRLSPDGSRERAREILVAGVRATAQLAAVSLVIGWVVHHTAALYAFLLLMLAVATRTAGRRVTPNRTWWWAAVPIAGPVVPVVTGLTLAGLLPVRGIAMVPVTGILIGGALTATVLAGRRALDELRTRNGEFEAGLALGLLDRDARLEVVRPAASDALLPGLDQTRTVGLVTLPGAFVGMLLGGASPVLAGAVQLFVLIALMAVQVVSVAVTVELIARGRLHRAEPDRLTA
ncbi:ABC transporter permease [Streptomyces kanamyceticus]|uniref:ABC transporter permease n=1 Tax=Streptomyces kanamyceticus TaxID=1967 RepID=A0A5J6G6N8_STRKN|nr:ABC transporter permease [Streptomyces kanamyceticus]QEU89645.1 ABC transporter permease [Streptomyces kanamyceticus]